MVIHLSKSVLQQLIASQDRFTVFRKEHFFIKGVDMDAMHRKFRILLRHGLMTREVVGGFYSYRITPKGKSFLLDRLHNNK